MRRGIAVALLTMLPASWLGAKPKVRTWQDAGAALNAYRTYTWQRPGELPRQPTSSFERFAHEALARQLAEKGRRPSKAPPDADFYVFVHYELPARRGSRRPQPYISGWTPTDDTLYVELRDIETDQPVWRASIRPVLRRGHEHEELINRAVERLLADLPAAPR